VPTDIQDLAVRHNLKSHDIAERLEVNPATAKRMLKSPGPGYIPATPEQLEKLKRSVGE
jgi:hypothetical protein